MKKSKQKSVEKSTQKSVEKSTQKSVEKSAQKYLCICVFARQTPRNIVFETVFVYFLYLCIYVFMYLCICVFARQTPWNIVFEVLVPLHFQKYSIC